MLFPLPEMTLIPSPVEGLLIFKKIYHTDTIDGVHLFVQQIFNGNAFFSMVMALSDNTIHFDDCKLFIIIIVFIHRV